MLVSLVAVAAMATLGEPSPTVTEGIVLIGAGFGRTGTASTKKALELLDIGPTHHMVEVFENFQFGIWRQIFESEDKAQRQKLLRQALHGYRSSIDFPSSVFYRDLMEMYPDAKVLLTTRSAESWYRSAWDTILFSRRYSSWSSPDLFRSWIGLGSYVFHSVVRIVNSDPGRMGELLWDKAVGDAGSAQEYIAAFNAWEAQVEATVPSERLLKFSVKEGWGPLVQFLGVAEPDTPFPRVNDKATFRLRMAAMAVIGYAAIATPIGLLVFVWRCIRRRRDITENKHKNE